MSDTDKRLGILETKSSDYERRLRLQEKKNEQLNEIATYMRLQYEHNKTQDQKLDRLDKNFEMTTKVLDGINTNLLSLNHDIKSIKDKQEITEAKVESLEEERVAELKKFKKESEGFRATIVTGIITGTAVTVLGAVLLIWFGLGS